MHTVALQFLFALARYLPSQKYDHKRRGPIVLPSA